MTKPLFELAVERRIAAPPERVWSVWTERLAEWWAPKPWTTRVIENDFRPGGESSIVMSGPDGDTEPMDGVFLEVTRPRRIVLTNAFTAGWTPSPPFMVALFDFEADGAGTNYRAAARHWDEATLKQHEAMGFVTGWGQVADQLAALAET